MHLVWIAALMAGCSHRCLRPPVDPVPPEISTPDPEPPPEADRAAGWTATALPVFDASTTAPGSLWSAAPLPGHQLLLAVRGFGAVRVDPTAPARLAAFGDPELQLVTAAPDGALGLAAGFQRASAYDLLSGSERWQITYDDNPRAAAWSADGADVYLAVGRSLERHDAATGALRWRWTNRPSTDDGDPDSVSAVALTPDGITVITHDRSRVVALLAANGAEVHTLLDLGAYVGALALSPDGEKLVIGGWDKQFHLIDRKSKRELAVHLTAGWAQAAAWSPDGTRYATLDLRGALTIHTADGAPIAALEIPSDAESGLLWHPDGTLHAWAEGRLFAVRPPA